MTSRILLGATLALLTAAIASTPSIGRAAQPLLADLPGQKSADAVEVDVELVLGVDISYSMDPEELALQREGYIAAITSSEFLDALKGGMHGRVAITYFEWAGAFEQRIVVPWRVVDGLASAEAFTQEIARAPMRRSFRTSISGALLFALPLFERNGFRGLRRVIDISGDGANNQGQLVTLARDEVVEKGITINGLPIMIKRPNSATMDIVNLDVYYEDCVIGGPGAFVVPVENKSKFREAIRTKLVLEVAGRQPDARVMPVSAKSPRVSCTIGERLWQERWGN